MIEASGVTVARQSGERKVRGRSSTNPPSSAKTSTKAFAVIGYQLLLCAAVATPEENDALVVGAAQLILSEKRTLLSLMRTGIAVFALPLATISALIATSEYYDPGKVLHLFIPVMLINAGLVILGVWLIVRAIRGVHHTDRLLAELKRSHPSLVPWLDQVD